MRHILPATLLLLAVLPACKSPKTVTSPVNEQPATRSGTPAAALAQAPAEAQADKTRDAASTRLPPPPDVGCTLSLTGDPFLMDCRFEECPVQLIGSLVTADTLQLTRAGSSWMLEAIRNQPPLKPERNFLNVRRRNAELIVPGVPAGRCRFATPTKEMLQSESRIGLSGIQVRRTL